nr:hypothetical protein GCM10020093_115660 [Planobispora longispora]
MAREWEINQRQRRTDHRAFAQHLADLGALAAGVSADRAADIIYTLFSPEMYHLLTIQCGWSPADWETWIHRMLTDALFAGPDPASPPTPGASSADEARPA